MSASHTHSFWKADEKYTFLDNMAILALAVFCFIAGIFALQKIAGAVLSIAVAVIAVNVPRFFIHVWMSNCVKEFTDNEGHLLFEARNEAKPALNRIERLVKAYDGLVKKCTLLLVGFLINLILNLIGVFSAELSSAVTVVLSSMFAAAGIYDLFKASRPY